MKDNQYILCGVGLIIPTYIIHINVDKKNY